MPPTIMLVESSMMERAEPQIAGLAGIKVDRRVNLLVAVLAVVKQSTASRVNYPESENAIIRLSLSSNSRELGYILATWAEFSSLLLSSLPVAADRITIYSLGC